MRRSPRAQATPTFASAAIEIRRCSRASSACRTSSDNETFGFGVRVLVDGAWGFAASRDLTRDEVARVARQAVTQARANRTTMVRPVTLAPVTPTPDGAWRGPARVDPFDVPIEEKVSLLLAANAAALAVAGARFVNSQMFFLREEKTLATTDGTYVVQTIFRAQPTLTVTAVASDNSDFQTRQSNDIQPMGKGYEHVIDAKLVENAPRWAEEAVRKLSAKPVEVGRYDLVLHPSHLWLTIHESIAHPTELDRAMGYEANYAGTSLRRAAGEDAGHAQVRAGVHERAGRPLAARLAVARAGGTMRAFGPTSSSSSRTASSTTIRRRASRRRGSTGGTRDRTASPARTAARTRSPGPTCSSSACLTCRCCPGEQNRSWEDLIAATDRGIAIVGEGSFSIDQQRYNAQFGGQVFYEIRGGKIVGMLKDVAYQLRTPEFWNSMDMIGGRDSYMLGGAFNDGKGQPSQSNAVSHGCVPARFRNVNVINTGRRA